MSVLHPTEFAKIFIVDGWQVLFYVEPDGDEGRLHQIVCDKEVASLDVTLGFDNQDDAWAAFNKVTEATARSVHEKAISLLKQLAG